MTAAKLSAMALRLAIAIPLGLIFGSFLTVVVHRVPRKESVAAGRSRCPSCGREIPWYDNVPLLSYVLLRGRCRRCRTRISPAYPLTEAATAALAAGAALAFDDVYLAVVVGAFLAVLLALALIDARHRTIPNAIVYPSLLAFAVALAVGAAAGRPVDLLGALAGLAIFGGVLLALALIRPGGMGMGDVKLAGFMGLVLGSLGLRSVVVGIVLGILAGGIGGVVALALGRSRKSAIPFGPFLAAGGAAAALWGPRIASAYLSAFR